MTDNKYKVIQALRLINLFRKMIEDNENVEDLLLIQNFEVMEVATNEC